MESNKTKNILLSCAVIVLITCVCAGLIAISGIAVSSFWPLRFSTEEDLQPLPGESIQVPTPLVEPDEDLPGPIDTTTPEIDEESLPEELAEVVLEIEAQVTELRGLTLRQPVPRIMMTAEEEETIVVNDFFAEYTDEDARQDVLVLSLLGLIPADFDLKSLYTDLYSEQILGFYDSETKEIYVVQGTTFGGSEKLTYAHEFVHVLQDQNFGFEEGLNLTDEACEADSERCAAALALSEGDASLTELLWFQTYATREDYQDIVRAFQDYASPVLDAAPPFIQADLIFPYEQGFAFVQNLYDRGGFEAIDAAYLDPPSSTEQILHPNLYPWDVPQVVTLPDLSDALGEGWMLFDQNVMGEWFTYLILGQAYEEAYRLAETQASAAAEGWGGDAYAFYLNTNTDALIFILDTIWDSTADANEFAAALTNYADLRWATAEEQIAGQPTWTGVEGIIVFMQAGDRTLWIIAPTDALAESVLLELQ